MEFLMGGQVLRINDLSPAMNKAFIALHGAYLGDQPYDLGDFEREALAYFDQTAGNPSAHDRFFNAFTIIWQAHLDRENLAAAESLWADIALRQALLWEKQNPGKFIHKGTPFYFWGMTAIIRGELDKGYALMHQALDEDARTSGLRIPQPPAFAFATLNYAEVAQTFRAWVLNLARFLDQQLTAYRTNTGGRLTLQDFNQHFLLNAPSVDTIFLFSYCVGRLFFLARIPQHALMSEFAGQLETNLLFDIALVIDAAIRGKNPSEWKFRDDIALLSNRAKLALGRKQLGWVNRAMLKDFDATLSSLIMGSFRFRDGTAPGNLERDLAITYGIRNRGAHSVSSAPTLWQRFDDIQRAVFNALFLTVEVLYLNP